MKTKKILILAASIFMCFNVFARDAFFSNTEYEIKVSYNDKAFPGDAVFVKMRFIELNKAAKHQLNKTEAKMILTVNDKKADTANFYILPKETNRSTVTFLCGIPLSSWWTENDKLTLTVKYNIYGQEEMEFTLPFQLEHKDFVVEEIPLDEKNSAIKTDTSQKRMEQIEKLNAILATINPQDVYETRPFKQPVDCTRLTSFFGDRRTYRYTNGKKSTNLHYGIDYGVPTGTNVYACGEGKVVLAEERITTGYSVVIEHLPGLYSLYYHMDKINVKVGDKVNQGTLLGQSGCTGLATGPHLHWEIRLNMSAVSPDFFKGDFTQSLVVD